MNRNRLLERFLRYVRIDTTASPDETKYPSSPGQLELGRLLVAELRAMGLRDARQDEHGIVLATVPASGCNTGVLPAQGSPDGCATGGTRPGPTIALCSHLDTSPETTGAGVNPQVIENYSGTDIALRAGRAIRVADNQGLELLRGRTLITSDGTTLLGADDKAGVAIIMEAAAWLAEHPEIPHGPLRICFTCDEETGHGVDHLQLEEIGATVCYTLDGHATCEIDVETFSADQAVVTVQGVNIHPSIAKGRMTNALRAAADFLARLPRDRLSPESTDGREGFLHPYDIAGGVGEVKMKILLRDFDAAALTGLAERLRQAAAEVMREFPAAKISVAIERQYRNMAEGLLREPRAVAYAEEALRRLGRSGKADDRPRRHRRLAAD